MRNIIFRLCDLLEKKVDCIRNLIGICHEHFLWRNHQIFKNFRKDCILASFLQPNLKYWKITRSFAGMKCAIVSYDQFLHAIFLDKCITNGIFRWTVDVQCQRRSASDFCMGIAHSCLACVDAGIGTANGSCGLGSSGLVGVEGCRFAIPIMISGELITAEVNITNRTLCFFVGMKRLLVAISCIPTPLYFGVSGSETLSFTSAAFRRLSAPTPTPTPSACVPSFPSKECHYFRCRAWRGGAEAREGPALAPAAVVLAPYF